MSLFKTRVLTFTRATGDWVGGEWVPDAPTTITARGTLQPMSGKELENDPTGQYTKDTRKFYTSTELLENDETTADGVAYVVKQAFPYQSGILSHYKVILNKQKG
jgi:hypothetical protein